MKQYALQNKLVIGRQFLDTDIQKSIGFFEEVMNSMPSLFCEEDLIDFAFAYQDAKEFQKALSVYSFMTESFPLSSRGYYGMAMIYEDLQDFEQAIIYYKKAIDINPFYFEAYFYLAGIYDDMDCVDESIEIYTKALELSPNDYWCHVNLGSVYESIDQDDLATDYFKKALSIDYHFMAVFNLGVVAKKNHRMEESISYYLDVIRMQKDYGYAYLNLSIIYRDQNKIADAVDILSLGIANTIDKSYLYYHRACNYALLNRRDQAIGDLRVALKLYPDFESYMTHDEDLKTMQQEMKQLFDEV